MIIFEPHDSMGHDYCLLSLRHRYILSFSDCSWFISHTSPCEVYTIVYNWHYWILSMSRIQSIFRKWECCWVLSIIISDWNCFKTLSFLRCYSRLIMNSVFYKPLFNRIWTQMFVFSFFLTRNDILQFIDRIRSVCFSKQNV